MMRERTRPNGQVRLSKCQENERAQKKVRPSQELGSSSVADLTGVFGLPFLAQPYLNIH